LIIYGTAPLDQNKYKLALGIFRKSYSFLQKLKQNLFTQFNPISLLWTGI